MNHAVAAGQNLDKSAEVFNPDYFTVKFFAGFNFAGHAVNPIISLLEFGGINAGDCHPTVIIHIHFRFGFSNDFFDIFAAWTNQLADFINRNRQA